MNIKKIYPLIALSYSLTLYAADTSIARGEFRGGDFRGGDRDFQHQEEFRDPNINRNINRDTNINRYNPAVRNDLYRNPAVTHPYQYRNLETQGSYLLESQALENAASNANQAPVIIQQPQQSSGNPQSGGFYQGGNTFNPEQ